MNIAKLQNTLVAAARAHPPGDAVPYAFEQRIMARLKSLPELDRWAWWTGSLWRATGPCVMVTVFLGVWAFTAGGVSGSGDSLSADLESTVYAAIETSGGSW